mgnify:CR=1 FL=1
MKYLVPIQGKLLVSADSEAAAKERANTWTADHGVGFLKAASYGTEQVEDAAVVPVGSE